METRTRNPSSIGQHTVRVAGRARAGRVSPGSAMAAALLAATLVLLAVAPPGRATEPMAPAVAQPSTVSLAAPAPVPATGTVAPADTAAPVPTITSPATARFVRTTDAVTVAWSVADPALVASTTVEQQSAAPDARGGCAAATFSRSWTASDRASGFLATGLAPDRCYRWGVTVVGGDGIGRTATSAPVRTLTAWTGRYDTWRAGVFSSQARINWCTAASTQMILNVTERRTRHWTSEQQAIWAYEQAHDRYPDGVARGSDPQGWAAALRAYGASPAYAWHRSATFEGAVRVAATRIRLSGKPVGVTVMHGNHAWVVTGFEATADPAVTSSFTVTAVYVLAPLYPRPEVNGYDPAPHTRLGMTAFARVYRPYHDSLGSRWSIWEGSWVTILP